MSKRINLPDAHLVGSMLEVVLGSQNDTNQRREMLGVDTLQEYDQQFQVAISGLAAPIAAYNTITINFNYEFIIGGSSRDGSLVYPHFTFGHHLTTPTPVMVTAMVASYDIDANYTTRGADIHWGAWTPDNPPSPIQFSGWLHLNFQGWGAPAEVDVYSMWDDPGSLGGTVG